jgi:hypothetical protein
MPRFDGTGPTGAGPMTGWGRGYCNGGTMPYGPAPAWGTAYSGRGYGPGFGRGFGRGFRRGPGPDLGRFRGRGGYGRGRGFGGGYALRGPVGGRW